MPNRNSGRRRIKPASNKKKQLSNYHKRHILTMLKESNCHPKELRTMVTRFHVDEDLIKNFINEQAELAQNRIEHSLKSQHNKHFLNLDDCARQLLEHNECATDNTLPVTLEAIANHEDHPSPSEINGIDLKVLYQMLANLTAGYPVDELENGPTKEFLKLCYSDLINNSSGMEAKSLKKLLNEQDNQTQPVYSWLCNCDYSQYLLKMFKEFTNDNEDDNDGDNNDDDNIVE